MLDPDVAAVKAVFRTGGVDFVVNTLDEAMRVLKNEIRKRRPLSVALEGAVQPALEEMLERGVLPDMQMELEGEIAYPGAVRLELAREGMVVAPSVELRRWLQERRWVEAVLERATTAEMRELDLRLLEMVPEGDAVRRLWVQRIAHYQRPVAGGARVVWLAETELAELET